jgi:Spy/CpxP family protein refolding chaperone
MPLQMSTLIRGDKKGGTMKKTLAIFALIGVIGLGSALIVGCHHRGPDRGAAFMLDYMAEALDLTEDQQATVNLYKDEIMARVKDMHSEKKQMYSEIKAQLAGDAIDRVRVKALVAEHRDRMDEVINLIVDRVADFHATLSPDQRTKLVNKMEKFEKKYRHGWKE